ncbi:MAG: hypothetical protein M1817_000722 [Caeruleum heppii]|nr:MAG: hypothetical protein M1817_000722 [Caeruleum heppii]
MLSPAAPTSNPSRPYIPKLTYKNSYNSDSTSTSHVDAASRQGSVTTLDPSQTSSPAHSNVSLSSQAPSSFMMPPTSHPREERRKKSSGRFSSFFSVKEPSTQAFVDYQKAQSRKAANVASKHGYHGPPAMPGVSAAKLPANVPKVNSKWDGLPKALKEKEKDHLKEKRSSRRDSTMTGKTSSHLSSNSTVRAKTYRDRSLAPSSNGSHRTHRALGTASSGNSADSFNFSTRPLLDGADQNPSTSRPTTSSTSSRMTDGVSFMLPTIEADDDAKSLAGYSMVSVAESMESLSSVFSQHDMPLTPLSCAPSDWGSSSAKSSQGPSSSNPGLVVPPVPPMPSELCLVPEDAPIPELPECSLSQPQAPTLPGSRLSAVDAIGSKGEIAFGSLTLVESSSGESSDEAGDQIGELDALSPQRRAERRIDKAIAPWNLSEPDAEAPKARDRDSMGNISIHSVAFGQRGDRDVSGRSSGIRGFLRRPNLALSQR